MPSRFWRDSADFIITAALPEAGHFEQLWAKNVGENQLEICCIPFFLDDVALGDVVETAPQGGKSYVLKGAAAIRCQSEGWTRRPSLEPSAHCEPRR